MAAISIRGLDERVKGKLRQRAAVHGRSMEAEVREILTEAVTEQDDKPDLFETLTERFDALGGVTLNIPERQPLQPRVNLAQ